MALSLDLFEKFVEAGAVTYESTTHWKETSTMLDLVTVDGVNAKLLPDKYGYQIQLVFSGTDKDKFIFVEVLKTDDAAKKAQAKHLNWKIVNMKCIVPYKAVALNNGKLISPEEYEKTKEQLAMIGVFVQTEGRSDGGFINIPAFDDTKPADDQKKSVKFVAIPI